MKTLFAKKYAIAHVCVVCFLSSVILSYAATLEELLSEGCTQFEKKNYDAACTLLQQAALQAPTNVHAHILLGDTFTKLHKFEQALIHYRTANTLKLNSFAIIYRLAHVETRLGYIEFAYPHAQQLVALEPSNTGAQNLLADILAMQGDIQGAIALYQQSISSDPSCMHSYKSLGDLYLKNGDFIKAWDTIKAFDQNNYPATPEAPWWHDEDPTGKTLLLIHGNGFAGDPKKGGGYGDTFQAIRYAKELKYHGCTIIVETCLELIPILSLCPYIDTIIPTGSPRPHYDIQTTTGRLLHNVKATPQTIPQNIPYLYARPDLVTHWHQKLAPNTNFKIGICWSAKQYYWCNSDGFTWPQKQMRSVPAAYFAKLADVPNVSLYSLQKTYGELDALNLPIITFDQDFDATHGRFMDTAAVMKNLDLIITVDTAIAHLAGALGVQVWTLIPHTADVRWLFEPDTTVWYPSMRLFRQQQEDNWKDVMTQIHKELITLITTIYA